MSHTRSDLRPTEGEQTLSRIVVFGMPDDPHQLRDLLAKVLEIHPVDAQIQVHALPGVLPEQIPTHEAAQLAAAIRDLGVGATTIPEKDVPSLKRVRAVHHVRCIDEGLELVGLRGQRDQLIDWHDVTLISVGFVSESDPAAVTTTRVSELTLGPPRHSGDKPMTQHQNLEALIVTRDPSEVLRVDHGEMNYEYLGSQTATSATVNFRRLIGDLMGKATGAAVTPATRAFVEHGLLRHYEFASFDELQRYTLFQLLVRQMHSTSPPPGEQ